MYLKPILVILQVLKQTWTIQARKAESIVRIEIRATIRVVQSLQWRHPIDVQKPCFESLFLFAIQEPSYFEAQVFPLPTQAYVRREAVPQDTSPILSGDRSTDVDICQASGQ